ncbi:hypothetical protein [Streptomyces sp. NPDC048568]|uniref:hypothetical protein n=1 Tax=Streptomyces sp. NPDC048568 TaxID=3365571 RepID=UPI00371AD4AD
MRKHPGAGRWTAAASLERDLDLTDETVLPWCPYILTVAVPLIAIRTRKAGGSAGAATTTRSR